MENEVLNLTYSSSLTDLCEINDSFDTAVMQIAYAGLNRNGTRIDKEVFEKCLPTIYNCPVVCNYDRESDTIGSHDMAVVRNSYGELRIVNLTTPIGVVPESAKTYWKKVTEEDGTEHEYLCAEVLLWKRQEAYAKIKRDGITSQSMEITVKSGENVDGIYVVKDFEFTAFAAISAEPCFESALIGFAKQDFKRQFSQMMSELRETFNKVTASAEVDDIQNKFFMEGGEKVLNEKIELVEKYGTDVESPDFSYEEIEKISEKSVAAAAKPDNFETEPVPGEASFELASNIENALCDVLKALGTIKDDCGFEYNRYSFQDYDSEKSEVYCWDMSDWKLYGFTYESNGDSINIDVASKKRVKFAIVDFDGGEQVLPFAGIFNAMKANLQSNAEWEAKYQNASDTIASMTSELEDLRRFKADAESAAEKKAREDVFAQFADLADNEEFITLRNNCTGYDTDTLKEKCFAIRGRCNFAAKFSAEPKAPVLKIDRTPETNEPYGGLFSKYGSKD